MKLLVLGASSQLGLELTGLLAGRGIEYTAFASGEINLLKEMDVVRTLTRLAPDQVINAASYSNLEKAETDPEAAEECDQVNTRGVANLAEVCAHLNIPLIHHSTSYIFDGQKKMPYKEEDQPNPVSRYGMSKLFGENAIRETHPRHVIVRTDWMFSVHRNRFLVDHIDSCKRGGGRTQVMDHRFSPTPAEDVARVLLAIALQVDCQAEVWGTYHYCALQPLSEAQFVEYFLREAAGYDKALAQYDGQFKITVVPPEKPYIPNSVLNCHRIMETFGIKQRSRAAGVQKVLENLYSKSPGKTGAAPEKPVEGKKPAEAVGQKKKTKPRGRQKAGKTS